MADCLSYADIAETVVATSRGRVLRWWNVWRKRWRTAVSTLQLAVGAYQTQQARRVARAANVGVIIERGNNLKEKINFIAVKPNGYNLVILQ